MSAADRLYSYIQSSGDDVDAFSRRLGLSPEKLNAAAEGEGGALSLAEARKVEMATNGAVRAEELLGNGDGADVLDLAAFSEAGDARLASDLDMDALSKALRTSLGEETAFSGQELDALAALATEAVAHTTLVLSPRDPNAADSALAQALELIAKEILLDSGARDGTLDDRAAQIRRRTLVLLDPSGR